VTGRVLCWEPDRELHPQYAGVPDVEHFGLILSHDRPDGWRGVSAITFDGPVQHQLDPNRPKWTVESLDPLTLSPSILCTTSKGGCGLHGFIRDGKWVPA
jgi:hypothetical protein